MPPFKHLTTLCGMGTCPTITRDLQTGDYIIIGRHDENILASPTISTKIGEGETAVVIPKGLLSSFLEYLINNAN